MLKRQRVETIPATLTIRGQGETVKFNVTYINIKSSELVAEVESPDFKVAETILKIVKDWECEYPLTSEGLQEMEDDRPGMLFSIIEGFHSARKVERVKN